MFTNAIHTKGAYYPYPTDFCQILLFLKKGVGWCNPTSKPFTPSV